jgi:hypothetical protein
MVEKGYFRIHSHNLLLYMNGRIKGGGGNIYIYFCVTAKQGKAKRIKIEN